jgi:hypothetical protein
MGSICLLAYSISSSLSAVMFNNFLIKRFSTKTLFIVTHIIYIICCVSIFYSYSIYKILPFCAGFGILLTSLTTLPYQMISKFHEDDFYVYDSKTGKPRGLGIDCALLCSSYFLSQIIISLFMSSLIFVYGNGVIMLCGAIFSLIGILLALFYVNFPQK